MNRMRIATWNLWGRHGEVERRLPVALDELEWIDADVVGLQEVAFSEPDVAAAVAERLGWPVLTSPRPGGDALDGPIPDRAVPDGVLGQGNALVSRWPVVEWGWRWLDVGDMVPHRTALWARFEAPWGRFVVVSTHLSHRFDQSELRCRQLEQVAELVAERRDPADAIAPVVVGDLNAVPDSDEIRRMTGRGAALAPDVVFSDAWEQVGEGPGLTWSRANPHVDGSAWPDRRLDYVAVSWPRKRPLGNPVSATLFGTDPDASGTFASDHFGLLAELHTP